MRWIYITVLLLLNCAAFSQPKTDMLLKKILAANNSNPLTLVLQNLQTYRIQIIYTRINRNKKNLPTFKNYYYNYDPDLYFNPASTVKLPLALLALEKLNNMRVKDVSKCTPILYDSSYTKQTPELKD